MALIVQKFGGSSVANAERVFNVAKIITDCYSLGNDVVVVLSAQGDTTDELIEKAHEINPNPSRRELDALMSTGEQISVCLMAMAIERLGFPVVSLTGWQADVRTTSHHSDAKIKKIGLDRLRMELDRRNIVLVTGFQGVNKYGDVTTLGRGGSDTSAVALACALKANLCQIYTDVDGVYTADPRTVPNARKLDQITYGEMLELASLGAKVLHNRSVELAKSYHMELEVLSSFTNKPGTIVKEAVSRMEKTLISGVARDDKIARIALTHLKNEPGVAYRIFSLLAKNHINIDIIIQSIGREDTKDISFTVPLDLKDETVQVLNDAKGALGFERMDVSDTSSKISVVGAGIVNNPGVAAMVFEALYEADININMISTSEIKISVLIDKEDAEKAVRVIHDKFFN
ncbi:MAG: aspartate kinase [Oscillospiraceae bacterium]|nr:aspartate kinase [Oscillospiraceae bacterium]